MSNDNIGANVEFKETAIISGTVRIMKKSIRLFLFVTLVCLPWKEAGCLNALARGRPSAQPPYKRAVNESARNIPVAYDVDVVVVGGTSGGVAAAAMAGAGRGSGLTACEGGFRRAVRLTAFSERDRIYL
ncbi:MAG: hypothetical protein ACYS74_19490 [Planctomycetota bacterium]|jgi:hypothetical protein